MTTHVVPRIRRAALGSQLAGLGLVRVLAEQGDRNLRCHFEGDALVIDTVIDELATWLVERYVPMPVLDPWNEGSGFGAKDKAPKAALDKLLNLPAARLDPLRSAYAIVEPLAARARAEKWPKAELVTRVRNRCPDSMLPWLDAAVIALDVDNLAFPPILGSGGNDGRLEFSTNFHQRLLDLLPVDEAGRSRSHRWARDWLAGTEQEPLSKAAVGQFDPGAAGTPNSSPFGAADSVLNPWVFVLMIEGTPLFASAPARRLSAQAHAASRAAMTFMTRGSDVGSITGSAAEESRGEIWVPWWDAPASYPAVKHAFNEGRAVWRDRTAVDSGQMYLAIASGGIAPGLAGFDRYTIVKRNGLAFSAVRADEVRVQDNDAVQVIADVEDWPDMVARTSELPANATTALRRFDAARVAVARSTSPAVQTGFLRDLLVAVTDIEMAVARSARLRDDIRPRTRPCTAANFIRFVQGESRRALREAREFRLALALASLVTDRLDDAPRGRTMRELVLAIDPPRGPGMAPTWRKSAIVVGLGHRPLIDVLAEVTQWLVVAAPYTRRAEQSGAVRGILGPSNGVRVFWPDLHAWQYGKVDEVELAAWFHALLALDWRDEQCTLELPRPEPCPVDPALATIAPFRNGLSTKNDTDPVRHGLTSEWTTQLVGGQVDRACASARRRLAQLGRSATVPSGDPVYSTLDRGRRLASALLPVACAKTPLDAISPKLCHDDDEPTDAKEIACPPSAPH